MIVACEDSLSEALLRRIVAVIRPDLSVQVAIGNRGKGYLKAKARGLNRTAGSVPVFLLVDADTRDPCPADLIRTWLHGAPQGNMLFRVAVMEVESWILADRASCSDFLAVPVSRIPADTDAIDNPKAFLVNLARRSRRRDIREELVPAPDAIVSVGPAYNLRLASFVSAHWSPTSATHASESLRRCTQRLGEAFA
jgi:hypothetical protein